MRKDDPLVLATHMSAILEEAPMGILLLSWDLKVLWYNGEGAYDCAVWNHGERKANALNPRRTFRVPSPLLQACEELKQSAGTAAPLEPRVLSEDSIGVYAHIILRTVPHVPSRSPDFEIQLDYRRPRGDRSRPLSAGALALLARLSAREREVAMGIREGLRTAQIAAEFGRSPLTIKTQLTAIYSKLGVESRTEMAALLNR